MIRMCVEYTAVPEEITMTVHILSVVRVRTHRLVKMIAMTLMLSKR